MHLGIKNFGCGAKKYLFGDGSYSGNIVAPDAFLYSASSYAAYTAGIFIDPANVLRAGRRITKLWCVVAPGDTRSLYIVRKDSTSGYTVVATTGQFTGNTTGWQGIALATPFDVPLAGEYYIAHWHTGNAYYTSGAAVYGGNPGQGARGGLFILLTSTLYVTSGCTISSNGASSGIAPVNTGGAAGGAGGGCVVIITSPAGLYNNGTIQALGCAQAFKRSRGTYGGSGGNGSVNIFTIG